jgi:hypothetical protein
MERAWRASGDPLLLDQLVNAARRAGEHKGTDYYLAWLRSRWAELAARKRALRLEIRAYRRSLVGATYWQRRHSYTGDQQTREHQLRTESAPLAEEFAHELSRHGKLWATVVGGDYQTAEVRLHDEKDNPKGAASGDWVLWTAGSGVGRGGGRAAFDIKSFNKNRSPMRNYLESMRDLFGARSRLLELREAEEALPPMNRTQVYAGPENLTPWSTAGEWVALARDRGVKARSEGLVGWNPPMRFTPDEYNYYANWVLHAVLGRLSEADGLMKQYGKPIRSMAKKLVKHLGVPKRPIYRGMVLDPGQAAGGELTADPEYTFVSWSEDKDVACWFADRDSTMSGFVRTLRPQIEGWIAESWPDPKRVLFHWSWAPRFPGPSGGTPIPLWRLAELHKNLIPAQVAWAMQTRKEVILRQDGKPLKVKPHADMGCPPTAELDGRLTFRPNPRCAYDHVAFSDYSGSRAGKGAPKRTALFTGDGRRRTIHFGAQGYEDYTMHHDERRRRSYLDRHGRREDWDRCDTAGSLSRWVLWGDSTSRSENELAFRRRFGLKRNPSPKALAKVRKAVGAGAECYPAAEVVYHANGGRKAGLTPMQQRHQGRSHWWVRGPGGEVWDPASAQFSRPVPYDQGVGKGFLTKRPSKRAKGLARRAGVRINPDEGLRSLERRWQESGSEHDALTYFHALTRSGTWYPHVQTALFWDLVSTPAGRQALLEDARVNPKAQPWELNPNSYVLLRAYRMGYMGRVEARHGGTKSRFHVAARKMEWPRSTHEQRHVVIPASNLFLVSTTGPGAKTYAGKVLGRGSGRPIEFDAYESMRLMTAKPHGKLGYRRVYWKNPEPGASADWEEFRAAIPAEVRNRLDAMGRKERSRVMNNWWHWWVRVGQKIHRKRMSQGLLFADWGEGPWSA